LAQEAVPRRRRRTVTSKIKWSDWEQALSGVENPELVTYYNEELAANRECYLRKRILHYRIEGKRRWFVAARKAKAYVWQNGRFDGDIEFWKKGVSVPDEVKPVKDAKCLSFLLATKGDFQFFHQAATKELQKTDWLDAAPEEDMEEVAEE